MLHLSIQFLNIALDTQTSPMQTSKTFSSLVFKKFSYFSHIFLQCGRYDSKSEVFSLNWLHWGRRDCHALDYWLHLHWGLHGIQRVLEIVSFCFGHGRGCKQSEISSSWKTPQLLQHIFTALQLAESQWAAFVSCQTSPAHSAGQLSESRQEPVKIILTLIAESYKIYKTTLRVRNFKL